MPGLRERKRQATHQRIADEAARLASDRGIAATTVEDIAAAADVGRSTFFRYFDTKEIAVAEGFSTPWLTLVVEALEQQPAHLSPVKAILSAFAGFAKDLEADPAAVLRQAKLSQSSPGLQAWTWHVFARFEHAIADAISPRFPDLEPDDPRPLVVGALAMAAVRHGLEQWLATDGEFDLAAYIRDALTCVVITTESAPDLEVAL